MIDEFDISKLPGDLYPDRCMECLELYTEDYGSLRGKCAMCALAASIKEMLSSRNKEKDN